MKKTIAETFVEKKAQRDVNMTPTISFNKSLQRMDKSLKSITESVAHLHASAEFFTRPDRFDPQSWHYTGAFEYIASQLEEYAKDIEQRAYKA